MTTNNIITKRFVIRKTLINTNTIITFTTNKGKKVTYDHDKVYNAHKQRFEDMPCFTTSINHILILITYQYL